jgi:S1-C subfamily serine protease
LPVDSGAYVAPRGVTGSDPILPGSPADKAGLRAGDIITAVNGSKLGQQKSLTTMLNKFQPGDKVSLQVLRAGKTLTISATLGRMSDNN